MNKNKNTSLSIMWIDNIDILPLENFLDPADRRNEAL